MMAVKILNRNRRFKTVAAAAFLFLTVLPRPVSAETSTGVETPPTMKTGQGNYGYFRMEESPAVKPADTKSAPQQQPDAVQQPSYGLKNAVAGENSAVPADTVPQKSTGAAPWGADAGLQHAATQMSAGQYAQAVQTLKKVMARDASNADAHAYIGQCYYHLGMTEDARKSLERALMANPRHMGAHLYIGLLHLKNGQRDLVVERLAALRSLCQGGLCEEENHLADRLNTTKPVAKTAKEEERNSRWMFWKKD